MENIKNILYDNVKIYEYIQSKSMLYTTYGVKDKNGKYRNVIDIDTVIEILRSNMKTQEVINYEPVDLRTCKKGDILISKHGTILKYVQPLPEDNYMDHEVEYVDPKRGNGSRTHDGYVFRKKRLETDDDIVKIIHI